MEKPHKNLRAWQLGMELVQSVYALTLDFPPEEKFGLTAQLRRSAVSIPSNIAEGAARESEAEFVKFLRVARSSLSELDTQMEISLRLNLLKVQQYDDFDELMKEADRVLSGLISHVES